MEQARTNKAELAALLEQVALLETKQELLEQQTELDDLRCAVAEMEENERELLGEVSPRVVGYLALHTSRTLHGSTILHRRVAARSSSSGAS